ncbi:hypothetical protein GCM10009122_39820 [Fulvivirga kasyanovii]|uniref:WG repeat-containing protein n=1 Tax=Fulvivirga kasyanovii TaxID=396812 RepID=A0ABW9RSH8_9BACT|nr:hypothetical protein [Fulvivirga kasyanovii]MTI26030.1 hypothetical protein [Fulvivirga kasyanovii]
MKRVKYIFLSLIFCSCVYTDDEPQENLGEMEVYAPIYADNESSTINFQDSYPLKKPGKIYVYGSYLFVNEQYAGIHVINNQDPSTPEYLGFMKIQGNIDMAVRGNYLYADHVGDLVTINISDLRNPEITAREEGVYSYMVTMPPEQGYFECIDRARKHLIVGWEKKVVMNPECYW